MTDQTFSMEPFSVHGFRILNLQPILEENRAILEVHYQNLDIQEQKKALLLYSLYEIFVQNPELLNSIYLNADQISSGIFRQQDLLNITQNPKVDYLLVLQNQSALALSVSILSSDQLPVFETTPEQFFQQSFLTEEIRYLLKKLQEKQFQVKRLKGKERKEWNAFCMEHLSVMLPYFIQGDFYQRKEEFQVNYLFLYQEQTQGVYLISSRDYQNYLETMGGNPISMSLSKNGLLQFFLPVPFTVLQKEYLKEKRKKEKEFSNYMKQI